MKNERIKNIIILLLKLVAIEESFSFIIAHYFFEISPFDISPTFLPAFIALLALNWYTKSFQNKNHFRPKHIPIIFILLFFAVHFRAGIYWALNTFPLRDANMVLLTLQEPFDDFAYSMINLYLKTTIPQALAISAILTAFLYTLFNNTKKKLLSISAYFIATIVLLLSEIPVFDYIHILNNEPEKNAAYSEIFAEHYINPDSIKISSPEQKRNLILVYLESMETSFMDEKHGGNQNKNFIPEITSIAQHNINFGKNGSLIGGGIDAEGSSSTLSSFITRSLGLPYVVNYKKTPALHHYKSLYKLLHENDYHQIFFQGNSGLYHEFEKFTLNQKVNEVYGPDTIIQFLKLRNNQLTKDNGFNAIHDKETFKFASQILDTIHEPFSLTFSTIDTHAPNGLYDSSCIKSIEETSEDENFKATLQCTSRELDKFMTSLKSKPFYDNTTIIIFGDHLFMGTRLVKGFPHRKWIDIFVNTKKTPLSEEKRQFSDIDMFPTILSSLDFDIEGGRLGFGTDLFSDKETLLEKIGLDSLNNEIKKIPGHLAYESYLLKKMQKKQ